MSGDVGRPGTPILRDPTAILDGADYVLMESTYGGREHEPAEEAIRLLAEVVREVASHRGVLLIPAFAVGRTQEIVWQLDRLLSAGDIPHVPLYLDSPMASLASEIYRRYPGYYDEETFRLLEAGETPLDYPGAHGDEHRRAVAGDRRGAPADDRSCRRAGCSRADASCITCGSSSTIRMRSCSSSATRARARWVPTSRPARRRAWLDGAEREVRCGVRSISGFSAHADESELLEWLGHFARAERRPRRVFLVHGDPEAVTALEPRVRALGLEPYRPTWREEVVLD